MLSSNMLLLNLILPFDVTFSTPTPVYINHAKYNHAGAYTAHGHLEMYTPPALAVFLIAMKFLMGAVIGLVVAALLYWPRFSVGLAVRSALLGGLAFLLACEIAGWRGIAGWPDSSVYFYNGQRLDVTPDGESLWLRIPYRGA